MIYLYLFHRRGGRFEKCFSLGFFSHLADVVVVALEVAAAAAPSVCLCLLLDAAGVVIVVVVAVAARAVALGDFAAAGWATCVVGGLAEPGLL